MIASRGVPETINFRTSSSVYGRAGVVDFREQEANNTDKTKIAIKDADFIRLTYLSKNCSGEDSATVD